MSPRSSDPERGLRSGQFVMSRRELTNPAIAINYQLQTYACGADIARNA
jgi:hypothetical protein